MKYLKEWPSLITLGESRGLVKEQIYLLLALRELEDGPKGNEFSVRAVQHSTLDEQAIWAIDSIKANQKRWQRYILGQSYMDFVSFFAYIGGPYGTGWHEKLDLEWVNKLKELMKGIEDEFKGYSGMGEGD